MLNIQVFESIDDPLLKSEWERLEQEADVFPQSTYHWCATWWKHLSGRRKLHVVMVLNEDGKALAIAPLCIERHFGVRVLRSFPIHFGDFYTFIISTDKDSQAIVIQIVDYMLSEKKWRWVRLEQVVESSELARVLEKCCFRRKRMTACVIADFSGMEWDKYLEMLKKRFRQNVRRRLRKIEKSFNAELITFRSWDEYQEKFEEMTRIHRERWVDDNVPAKGKLELACLRKAIEGQFQKGKMVYYQLLFDNVPVAYRLGFLYRGTFYNWHTSFVFEYRKYSVGIMILAFMIKHFMETDVTRINFMAGHYDWKLDWSPDRRTEVNYVFSSPSDNTAALSISD